MTPNPVKIGNAVTFMKNLATVASLIFLSKTLIWNKITFVFCFCFFYHVLAIKFSESCRAGGKWAYKEYLQKIHWCSFFYLIYHFWL